MAEIDSRLPLLVKGFNLDPANAFSAAQQTKGQMLSNEGAVLLNKGRAMGNELAGMELGEAKAKLGAMHDFREARTAGDPNATDKLAAFPDMQVQMETALNALDEDERLDAVNKGRRVADAARSVAGLDGDAQVAAWDAAIDKLVEAGDMDEATAENYRGNPSPLVLNEALRMGETLEQYIQRQDAAAVKALADRKERPQTYDDLTFSQKLEIDKAATDKVKAATGNALVPPKPELLQQMFEQAKSEILATVGIKPPSTTVTPPPIEGGAGAAAPTSALPPPAEEPASAGEVDWTTLTPDAQEEAIRMLAEGVANPNDRAAAVAEFDRMFGEGAAATALKGR